MRTFPSDVAFTPAVKAVQEQKGSRRSYARVIEGDAALEELLRDPAYPGTVERAILFTVEAWDVNCERHIRPRFSERQVAPCVQKLERRIAELQVEVERLRSITSPDNTK